MVNELPNEGSRILAGPEGTLFCLGRIEGELDPILTGEQAVWVKLAEGLKPEDVMGAEVFVRVRG